MEIVFRLHGIFGFLGAKPLAKRRYSFIDFQLKDFILFPLRTCDYEYIFRLRIVFNYLVYLI